MVLLVNVKRGFRLGLKIESIGIIWILVIVWDVLEGRPTVWVILNNFAYILN